MAEIRYKGKTFHYDAEVMKIENLNEITHDDAKEILFKTQDLFEKFGVKFYLAYGTLLGAVRDKDFIKGDFDVDLYTWDEERLFDILPSLEDNGMHLVRAEAGTYTFRLNERCYIDIYVIRKLKWFSPWSFYCYRLDVNVVPKKYFQGDQSIVFLGRTFLCTQEPEKLLRFWYGDTWNIPIGKFDKKYYYQVKTHYYCAITKYKLHLLLKRLKSRNK